MSEINSNEDLKFITLDYSEYGLEDLTALEMKRFRKTLMADRNLTIKYLAAKTGYNMSNPIQFEAAVKLLTGSLGLVTDDGKYLTYIQDCQMAHSVYKEELISCIADRKAKSSQSFYSFLRSLI